ncbi:MAG: ABC transporter permease [Paraglaciecola sp.]|nr:ABC transporter permease [Paraglaciecola sp.]NCT47787.1 ABC transporter permease [Paraglaciecola sp.]
MLISIFLRSIWSRKLMAGLTCVSIAISMFVLLSVAHIQGQIRQSFERSVSGVDLIVASRTSQLNLLLFSVYQIGYATHTLSWQSYLALQHNPQVDWAIPLAMGDSYAGKAVVGTTKDFFQHYKFANKRSLHFSQGERFERVFEVVVGAQVAQDLDLKLQQNLVLAHGTGKVSFTKHNDHPFTVVGILAPTGTPVDRTIYVPIEAIDAIHAHEPHANELLSQAQVDTNDMGLTAVLVAASSKMGILSLQRQINQNVDEALSAILPAVALQELWQLMDVVEQSLQLISWLVLAAAMLGLITMLLASMLERRKELLVLRALGAKASLIVLLIEGEALTITLLGCVFGYVLLTVGLHVAAPYVLQYFGLAIEVMPTFTTLLRFSGFALVIAALLALIPALLAYKQSLARGLQVN